MEDVNGVLGGSCLRSVIDFEAWAEIFFGRVKAARDVFLFGKAWRHKLGNRVRPTTILTYQANQSKLLAELIKRMFSSNTCLNGDDRADFWCQPPYRPGFSPPWISALVIVKMPVSHKPLHPIMVLKRKKKLGSADNIRAFKKSVPCRW